ncbi:MAG: hypothetical protein HXY25_09010 [Alphaproteobacteria bacterium]|nr:hypothetical protein [Alphaproteobacteria bacterium]
MPGLGVIRILTLTLGGTLILGMVVLIGAMIVLVMRGAPPGEGLAEGRIALPPGAAIEDMALGPDALAVRVRGPEGEAILLYDRGDGSLRGRFDVAPAE